jgi:hypothetical protein
MSSFGQTISAGQLPALLTFDDDTPGSPPATGGPNQPTSIFISSTETVLVQSSALGITSQPVVLDDGGSQGFVGFSYSFPPLQKVRIEATVSMNRLFDGAFFDTAAETFAAVTRLHATSDGDILARATGAIGTWPDIGNYAPDQPFRFRQDIDLTAGAWSFVLDDELNGFDDDPVLTGLPFINDLGVIPNVAAIFPGLIVSIDSVGQTVVAFDDILIVPEPATLVLSAGLVGLGGLAARRRRFAFRRVSRTTQFLKDEAGP